MKLMSIQRLLLEKIQFRPLRYPALTLFAVMVMLGVSRPGQTQEGSPHIITVTPSNGSPGRDVTIDLGGGPSFERDKSKILFSFEDLGHYDRGFDVTTEFVSSSKLRFRVPSNAGCGFYQVAVATTTKVGNRLIVSTGRARFEVTSPCSLAPRITGLSVVRALPGERVVVNGANLRPGMTVQLVRERPRPSKTIDRATSDVTPNQLSFRLPVSELGCGHTMLWVRDPAMKPGSSALPFYFSCDPDVLNVLSFNVMMMVDAGLLREFDDVVRGNEAIRFRNEMAKTIPTHAVMEDHDVIILQEVFSDSHRKQIWSQLAPMYPYQSNTVGSDRLHEQDGGVMILSRWPIENGKGEEKLFGDACHGDLRNLKTAKGDCLADKGVLYVRINKEGQPWHIFGTHLDAGDTPGDRRARSRQFPIIKDFIATRSRINPAVEPVIIGGDFNVNFNSPREREQYEEMIRVLKVTHPRAPNGRYPLATTPAGNYLSPGNCPRVGTNYLDYVFYSNEHLKPVAAFNEVLTPCDTRGRNLSDHYPVVGRFHLRPIPLEPIPIPIPRKR